MQYSSYRNGRRRRYSAERLRELYTTLLKDVDAKSSDFCSRRVEKVEVTSLISLLKRAGGARTNVNAHHEKETLEQQDAVGTSNRKKDNMNTAFRRLSAICVKEDTIGDTSSDCETHEFVNTLKIARQVELTVVRTIKEIGDIVVAAERASENVKTDLRDDDCFAYFCEKAVLSLFVDIVNEKPSLTDEGSKFNEIGGVKSSFGGVSWSAQVKAQIFETVSQLVSGMRDTSALYYIFSQNCINRLILSMLPLTQWTDPALSLLLPPFTDLLRALSVQLGGYPELFPFFTVVNANLQETIFPLFSVIVTVGTSSYAYSDSFVHATCLNLIVGIMRIPEESIQNWIRKAEREQSLLSNHIGILFLKRCQRISELTTGPVLDATRSDSVGAQLSALTDQIDALNDLFECDIRILNVRLCESLLQRLLPSLLHDLCPKETRHFLSVGVSDSDVTPKHEAAAQSISFVLARLFGRLDYLPFLRMLSVAILHPRSPSSLSDACAWDSTADSRVFVSNLDDFIQGNEVNTIPNPLHAEVMKALSGDYGLWRVVTASMLLENILSVTDNDLLLKLEVLPLHGLACPSTETSLLKFLSIRHSYESSVSTACCECISSLVANYLLRIHQSNKGLTSLSNSLLKELHSCQAYFSRNLLKSSTDPGFVDMIETIVDERYKSDSVHAGARTPKFTYSLSLHSSASHGGSAEPLVRKQPSGAVNTIEATRYYSEMAIHYRAASNIIDKLTQDNQEALDCNSPHALIDDNDDLPQIFHSSLFRPRFGDFVNVGSRLSFAFSANVSEKEANSSILHDWCGLPDDELVLVLDQASLFVLKPSAPGDLKCGRLVCWIPLLHVFGCAVDGPYLHIAVQSNNIESLIKNGNLLVNLGNTRAPLIAAQHLNRQCSATRQTAYKKIVSAFQGKKATEMNAVTDIAHGIEQAAVDETT